VSSLTPSSAKARGCPRKTGFLSLGLALIAFLALPTVGTAAAGAVSYTKDIQPILKQQCYVCHGDGAKESDLDLRTRESILQGGKHGLAVVPGKPSESLL
jgi:mono/diheme cytochrome c family protein